MNRAQLERLDREALISRAEEAGVARARILTRPELVDEILLRTVGDDLSRKRARGLFGVARDLLARVVERGLHLPDAADRIRTMSLPSSPRRSAPAALPTVTLAEIYATQGYRERAIETLESVLAREPDHAAARALLAQLQDESYAPPEPGLPPEREEAPGGSSGGAEEAQPDAEAAAAEPFGMLDDEPLPARYDVDECVAIPVDPTTLYVYWEVRRETLDALRATDPSGSLCLRLAIIEPAWDGPAVRLADIDVDSAVGDWFVRELPAGSVVRAALGWRGPRAFLSIAHSPALETPPGAPSPIVADVLVRWTPAGVIRVTPADADGTSIARALGRVRREAVRTRQASLLAAARQSALGAVAEHGGAASSWSAAR